MILGYLHQMTFIRLTIPHSFVSSNPMTYSCRSLGLGNVPRVWSDSLVDPVLSTTSHLLYTSVLNNSESLHLRHFLSHLPKRSIYLQMDMSANTSSPSSSIVTVEGMIILSFSNLDLMTYFRPRSD